MADRLYLKPKDPGAIVRYAPPVQDRILPADGDHVPNSLYWQRRLLAGDVVTSRPPKAGNKKES